MKSHIQNKTTKTYKRGQIIYHEADEPKNLYLIISGLVGLFHISSSGKETFFRVFGKNDIFGHRSYFAKQPYHASSVALSPITLEVISHEECQRICEENPILLKEMTTQLARDLGKAELRIAGLLDKTAHRRISESLVYLKLKHPDYTWTRKEIADYSGSSFETVARVMTILEKQKLIEKDGRNFHLLDTERILSLQEEDLH